MWTHAFARVLSTPPACARAQLTKSVSGRKLQQQGKSGRQAAKLASSPFGGPVGVKAAKKKGVKLGTGLRFGNLKITKDQASNAIKGLDPGFTLHNV